MLSSLYSPERDRRQGGIRGGNNDYLNLGIVQDPLEIRRWLHSSLSRQQGAVRVPRPDRTRISTNRAEAYRDRLWPIRPQPTIAKPGFRWYFIPGNFSGLSL